MTRLVAVAPNPSIDRFFRLSRLQMGEVNRPTVEVRVAGGKGLNVARAAATLGADVVAAGILAGHAGRWIDEELRREGVRGRWSWTEGETRSCVAIADDESEQLTELNETGPAVTGAAWTALTDVVTALVREMPGGFLSISGSLPPGAPARGVAALVATGRDHRVRAIVDVAGEPLIAALGAAPWLVKINAAEARDAALRLGILETGTPGALAGALAVRTGGNVVVTLGTEGALWQSPTPPSLVHVTLEDGRGSYPVGSGDAFLGGLAAALLAGEALEAALRLAVGAAAANALVPGAGRLDAAAARDLAQRARVQELPIA